jgi:3-oxoacyl-[acyl-carrier protein] reductase
VTDGIGEFGLDGRVAVVTGGGGWLGADICADLAGAGAAVAVVGRTPESIEAVRDAVVAAGGRAIAVTCDIADAASVDRMAATVIEELGGIDVLVNNAAIYPVRPWTEITEDEWDAVLATNLKGCFLCARACFDSMKERGRGRVVNLTSTTFHYGFPGSTVMDYVSSKAGIIGFTRALAREAGPDNVTANAISAGAFERTGSNTEEYTRWVLEHQSIKRRGTGHDIGSLVVFLAGDASSFITGQTIVIDGGMATI